MRLRLKCFDLFFVVSPHCSKWRLLSKMLCDSSLRTERAWWTMPSSLEVSINSLSSASPPLMCICYVMQVLALGMLKVLMRETRDVRKLDFSCKPAGGSILSTRCSETYETKTALMSLFGLPLWYFSQSPRVVIQVGFTLKEIILIANQHPSI